MAASTCGPEGGYAVSVSDPSPGAAVAALRPLFVARRWVDFHRVDSALCR